MRTPITATFVVNLLSPMALACSASLVSPLEVMGRESPSRFVQIVLAEVVATAVPQRLAELEAWHLDNLWVAAVNERAAAKAAAAAAQPRSADQPPPPPPEPRVPPLVLPLATDPRIELDLFVVENFLGPEQLRLQVPGGGPCTSVPKVGQQVLVFIEHSGLAHFMHAAGEGGHLSFDLPYLEQVRRCFNGDCPGNRDR